MEGAGLVTSADLPDAVYEELGKIAVRGAGLEQQVVTMLVLANGNSGEPDALLRRPSGANRNALRSAARDHLGDPQLRESVLTWLDSAEQLLEERNALMHAEWVHVHRVDGGEPYLSALHSKSTSMIPAPTIPARKLADRIQAALDTGAVHVRNLAVNCGLFSEDTPRG
jgi:hypothetical protein